MPCNCGTGPSKSIPVGRKKMGRGKCSTKKLPDINNCLETQNHPRSDFTTSRLLDTQISRNTGNQNNFQLPYLCHHHGINCAQPGHLGADPAARERGAQPADRPCLAVKPRKEPQHPPPSACVWAEQEKSRGLSRVSGDYSVQRDRLGQINPGVSNLPTDIRGPYPPCVSSA